MGKTVEVEYKTPIASADDIQDFLDKAHINCLALAKILNVDSTALLKYIKGFTAEIQMSKSAWRLLYLLMQDTSLVTLLREVSIGDD